MALPDTAVVAGAFVGAAVIGIATASGTGVAAIRSVCWAAIVGSAADESPPADFSVDLVGSDFEAGPGLAGYDWIEVGLVELFASALPVLSALTSEGGPLSARLFG